MEMFTLKWDKIKVKIYRYCSKLTRDEDDAKDLMQEVAIKAFLGYEKFKEKDSDPAFDAWIYKIAYNTFLSSNEGKNRRIKNNEEKKGDIINELYNNRDNEFESRSIICNEEKEEGYNIILNETHRLLKEIMKTNWRNSKRTFLNTMDYEIIRLKLDNPESTSKELAELLGITSLNFDTRYSRMIVDIRTYCFLHRPELLGGLSRINKILRSSQIKIPPLLNSDEYKIFKEYVVEKRYTTKPRNWIELLRSACTKIVAEGYNKN